MSKKIGFLIGIIVVIAALVVGIRYMKNSGEEQVTEPVEITGEEVAVQSAVEETDELKAELEQLNASLHEYYMNNKDKVLSSFGFMVSAENQAEINLKGLNEAGEVACPDELINADLLLMQKSDIFPGETNELDVFVGLKVAEGYLVTSVDYDNIRLSDEEYRSLILSCSADHGDIVNLTSESEEFEGILDAVNEAWKLDYDVDFRYLAADDKYAVCVVANPKDATEFRQFVLERLNNGWEVVVKDLERSENVLIDVNSVVPDLNTGLVPKYNIASFGDIRTNFVAYEDALVQLGLLDEDKLPASFSCGVGRFVYMEFEEDRFIGCVNDENKLEFYPVKDANEAIAYMLEYDDNPPSFIVKMNGIIY